MYSDDLDAVVSMKELVIETGRSCVEHIREARYGRSGSYEAERGRVGKEEELDC